MRCLSIIVSISFFFISFTQFGFTQNLKSLQAELVGKQLTAHLNMPASVAGIDLHPEKEKPLDLESYTNRINQHDVSIQAGEGTAITKVELEENTIVIYLGAGGYEAITESNTILKNPNIEKSTQQIELEEALAQETVPSEIARIKKELSKLKRNKSLAQGNNSAKAAEQKMIQSEKEKVKARNSGSRIHIIFKDINHAELSVNAIEKILSTYFTFH